MRETTAKEPEERPADYREMYLVMARAMEKCSFPAPKGLSWNPWPGAKAPDAGEMRCGGPFSAADAPAFLIIQPNVTAFKGCFCMGEGKRRAAEEGQKKAPSRPNAAGTVPDFSGGTAL